MDKVKVTWPDGAEQTGTPTEISNQLEQAMASRVGSTEDDEDDTIQTYQEQLCDRLQQMSGLDHWDSTDPDRLVWQMASAGLIRLEIVA